AKAPASKPVGPAGGYVVAKGDTLSGIARRHGVSVADLQSANGIQGSNIRIGQRLVIPGTAGEGDAVVAAMGTRQQFHTVAAGETPRRIAARYGVSVEDLLR